MIEVKGKHNQCKVFTDNVDNETISQLTALLNQESVSDSQIRIMPDTHAGKGCVIGTTMTLTDKVIPNLVGVDIGCVDKDTEFLSLDGWHRISEYNNQMIAVYDLDNNSTRFEYPEAFIKNEESEFYHFKTKYGIDQMLSKEHRCLVRRGNQNKEVSRDLPYVLTAEEIVKKHNRVKIGFRDNFVCDIPNIQNAELLKYTDLDLRLIVMYQADGYTSHTSDLLMCGFKKQRKVDRCEKLLHDACIPYDKIKIKEVTRISFRFKYDYKDLSCLYGLSKRQLGIICDECMFWDGGVDCMQYTSTIKSNVDFMQYAFLCNGYRTSISIDTRDKYNEGVCYRLSVANCRPRVQLAGSPKTDIKIEKSVDGFKYCFTTRTSFWVMRRNGCVCLTGNCGMLSIKLKERRLDLPKLDSVIRKYVPSGFNIHKTAIADSNIYCMECAGNVDIERAYRSLGTLGGGNHFIEVDKDKNGDLYLVIHTGSRHLGIEVCNYYQNKGYEALKETNLGGSLSDLTKSLVSKLKSEGKDKEISKAIKSLKESYNKNVINVPQALAYVEGANFNSYLHDMKIVQEHAKINRETIAKQILKYVKLTEVERFETIHNYIDVDNMILRKGSVSAQLGEKLIIPMNMRDGSLICVGKGNSDWNYSAPHGAGRLMSRSKAKESVGMDEFKASMEGIYTTSVNRGTLDESPMAYKPMQEIIDNVDETVDILDIVKPIYNFKASE